MKLLKNNLKARIKYVLSSFKLAINKIDIESIHELYIAKIELI